MSHWIATKWRYPKEKGKYLVTIDCGKYGSEIQILDFDGEYFYEIGLDDEKYQIDVVAWMMLPQPYVEKNWKEIRL